MLTSTIGRLFAPFCFAALTSVLRAGAEGGNDWPQWRGPDRTGVSPETEWSSVGAPAPLWRKDIGLGHSSFAVANGRVYTLGHDPATGLDAVYCFDAATGREVWTYRYASEVWDHGHDGGTLTTPTVVDGAVFTSDREAKVFCFDAASGDVRWSRDLRKELQLEPPTWGFSASPLVVDGHVVLNLGRLIALDSTTGAGVWATEKHYGIAYSTPAPFELEGRALLAVLTGDGLTVFERDSGAEVASHAWVKQPQIYPMTPVVVGDRIFISGGYERGCAMLRLTAQGLEEVWGGRVMRNKMSGCILHAGHLFGFDESILKCIDLDGNTKWSARGLGTGSMTIAGGRLVILDGKGQVIVAEANPAEYIELSKRQVFDDGTSWSSPVLSHGRIYCRTSKGQMACLDHRVTDTTTREERALLAGDVPTAADLVARHRAAMGDPALGAALVSVRLSGAGDSLRNTVEQGSVRLDWAAGRGVSWREDSGFQLAYNGEHGWVTDPNNGPEILQGEALSAAREALDVARLFDPAASYTALQPLKRQMFDNRPCFAVAATTLGGHGRVLYFEIATGLLAGHEGDGTALWTYDDYREFNGVRLPMRWAFYEPAAGEMTSATFEAASFEPKLDEDPFTLPAIIALLLRTPEELAAADTRLAEVHKALLGRWRPADAPKEAPDDEFFVADGFLQVKSGAQPASKLLEPNAEGVMRMLGAEYVSFTPLSDEAGTIAKIEVRVGARLEGTLMRVTD